jgi:amino acid transporter
MVVWVGVAAASAHEEVAAGASAEAGGEVVAGHDRIQFDYPIASCVPNAPRELVIIDHCSTAPLGDLAKSYAGSGMSEAISIGATVSAFASGLGAAAAGARILFALVRDTPLAPFLGRASTRTGAPAGALTVVLAIGVGAIVVQRIVGVSAVNAFFYPGTIGVLSIIVAYMLTNIGAINYLFVRARRVPLWEIVVPILGIVVLGYTLYKNVQGVPFAFSRFPLVVGTWLVVGLAIVLVSPGLSRRIGASLAGEAEVEQPSS